MLHLRPPRLAPASAIALASGGYFDFMDPAGSDFTVGDIAAALSKLCRFTGHCAGFYSVAEHSWHASHLVAPELALAALLHDAAEAFVGDVAKPLKALLPDYAAIERRAEVAIFARLGLPAEIPAEVKAVDLALLAAEQRQVMRNGDAWPSLAGIEPAPVDLGFWSPSKAEVRFMGRYVELTK